MAKVIIYDEYTNRLFTYNLSENDPMPYAYGNTMRVREFRGSSNSPTLWTAFTSAMRSSASGKAATERPASTTRA